MQQVTRSLALSLPAAVHCLEQLVEGRRFLDSAVLQAEGLDLKWLVLERSGNSNERDVSVCGGDCCYLNIDDLVADE